MISFKEYVKELVKDLPDFLTVGYALKEKRIERAKKDIENEWFIGKIESWRKGIPVDIGGYGLYDDGRLKNLNSLFRRYADESETVNGLTMREFAAETAKELREKPGYKKFFDYELPRIRAVIKKYQKLLQTNLPALSEFDGKTNINKTYEALHRKMEWAISSLIEK